MFSGSSKCVVRVCVLSLSLIGLLSIAVGCGQQGAQTQGQTQSKEDALKRLSNLSNEDKAVGKKTEGAASPAQAQAVQREEDQDAAAASGDTTAQDQGTDAVTTAAGQSQTAAAPQPASNPPAK